MNLPSKVLERILHHCGLEELGNLGRTCRSLNTACLSFVLSPASTEIIFPFLVSSHVSELVQFNEEVVMVSSNPFVLVPGVNIKKKFELLGRVVKKLTSLMPTVERIIYLCSLISRLDFGKSQSHFVKTRTLFGWIGILLHQPGVP